MAQFKDHHKLLPGMKPRPIVDITNATDKEETRKSENNTTYVFLKKCLNYKLTLEGKAAKVMCEDCENVTIALSAPPISGIMEIFKSKSVVVKLTESCQIPTFQIDDSTDVRIEIGNASVVSNIYFQRSKDIKVAICGEENRELDIDASPEDSQPDSNDTTQWIAYWSAEKSAFIIEKLKRNGIYPDLEKHQPQITDKN